MPMLGYRSITVSEDIVDRWELFLKNNRVELSKYGVTSLPSLLEYAHDKTQNEKKTISKLASKIKKIPLECKMYTLPNGV